MTVAGVWGRIVVTARCATYRCAELGIDVALTPEQPGIVAPEASHQVDPAGPVRFFVEFLHVPDLRYRYEWVRDDAVGLDGHASTLRTALSYETGAYEGLAVFLEAENVSGVGAGLYDNAGVAHLGNRRFDRPFVADPELTQMNQAALRYTRQGTTVQVGRQEILLDDQRFVGNVGWRQNHQSFDAVRVESSDVPGTTVNYAFIRGIHGIRGGAIPISIQVLNAAFAVRGSSSLPIP